MKMINISRISVRKLLLLSALVTLVFSIQSAYAQTVRTIAVTGTAKMDVAPNAFTMNFTFEDKGADLVSIKSAVDRKVENATQTLLEKGVSEKNIRSMDVTVYPWVENVSRERINKGFVYRRTVYFTHDKIDTFDSLIKDIASLSPSQIGQLALINEDVESLQQNLINEALENARIKAEAMAKTMKMEVGHLIFMSDGTRPPENMFKNDGRMRMADAAESFSQSLPGENTLSAQVEVVFEVHTLSRN
uniref:SIMPL domain-containing protein n=1 Tax=Ningiella ruwaisensis TaxID=2364274 RepID=UPI00144780F0|nr:SIMPL domain-containing protein [Ningiella ruwaisensis]